MKNHTFLGQATLGVVAGLLMGITSSWAGDQEGVIFSGRDQARTGWVVTAWGGVKVDLNDHGGRTPGTGYAAAEIDAKSEPYSGISIHTSYGGDPLALGLPLTSDLLANGVVELYLNTGKPLAGSESGDVKVKIVLTFVNKEGKTVPISSDTITTLDNDKETWELVRVPLATLLAKSTDTASLTALSGVNVQYIEAPTSEVKVTDCSLQPK